ncbi:DNA-binding NarL/FixJ family response regulator [Crossiella equi]|uniref:DNA-binding NarL/FixJ family response regulator n=1 Tax=Crossiella equi TaxID=130796 RepID=A0ABS5ADN7_9PSEU|nr:response regulator transcription factor [Crossiella equi]MBP2474417.1 DNA-binding NarL/FixJ family response regulator [Crossiella equi]
MESLRILVVDDHPLFRFGLCQTLQQVPEMQVAGEAATGTAAVAMADSLQPDVVVMDLNMPDFNGVEATRRIVRTSPHVGVLVLTMFDDNESVFAAMRAGARGYLLKGASPEEIVRAIKAVAEGQAIFGPAIASRLLGFFGNSARTQVEAFPDLTSREHEVLELIAQGENNAGIARKLVISGKTVRNHVSNIFAKLHVADRAEAIMRAREAGLGEN